MEPEVIIRVEGRLGRFTLNRASALHALTTQMCREMIAALEDWRDDRNIGTILIDHADNTRGFCAGGDIRMIADSVAGDGQAAHDFFRTEYQLDTLIQSYPKPVTAIIDGVTMGGGVGISVHATHRVATERTRFAMPETGIGLFPDVGGGWFLPRLPGQIGAWLGLTGTIIEAADCMYAGIATHYVTSARAPALKTHLAAAARADKPVEATRTALDEFSAGAGAPKAFAARELDKIDTLFAYNSVEEIIDALQRNDSDWSRAQLDILRAKSPMMSKAALHLFRQRPESFADDMAVEFRLAMRAIHRADFTEGVRAVVIDRDNAPRWSPASLSEISPADVEAMFAPLPAKEEWAPL